ncbi:hypothetical protein PIB30_054321 [Stylosanthes scabra]|uniref:PB1-like domain-containing protein n=1 Tax=Stylosanthes scabra TaxID=79078 RepID=A0ABU6TJZ3_9FABA|nr:hypothetical protein [Stylosanthes scabra]
MTAPAGLGAAATIVKRDNENRRRRHEEKQRKHSEGVQGKTMDHGRMRREEGRVCTAIPSSPGFTIINTVVIFVIPSPSPSPSPSLRRQWFAQIRRAPPPQMAVIDVVYHHGGEFVTNEDGVLVYEMKAIDVEEKIDVDWYAAMSSCPKLIIFKIRLHTKICSESGNTSRLSRKALILID